MIEIPQIDLTVIAPMLTVFAWASVLLLVDLLVIPRDRKRVTGYLALGGLGVAALIALPLWGKEATTFTSAPGAPGMVVLDNYALTLTWLFL
ncbi:MAG: NADH-quinone oxidoreductase subunit N, partial [Chloroflexaceae bacterium]